MLRSASIFLAAIVLPSLVLAWLAIQSARNQQILLEHQQAIISQDVTDSLAKNIRDQIDGLRTDFIQVTQNLLTQSQTPQGAAASFDHELLSQWTPAQVGFAVDLHGTIYSPQRTDGSAARVFRDENERFLSNRENVEVYSSLNSQGLFTKARAVQISTGAGKREDATGMARPSDAMDENLRSVASSVTPVPPVVHTVEESSVTAIQAPTAGSFNVSQTIPAAKPEAKGEMQSLDSLETKKSAEARDKNSSNYRTAENSSAGGVIAAPAPVFSSTTSPTMSPSQAAADLAASSSTSPAAPTMVATPPASTAESESASSAPSDSPAPAYAFAGKITGLKNGQIARKVMPQQNLAADATTLSNTVPEESDFRRLIGNDTSGALARFLDDKLQLMVWYRPPAATDLVFGAQLNQARLIEKLRSALQVPELKDRDGNLFPKYRSSTYCLALLDDAGHPVALSIPGFNADWKHPFVATEIGETLPHWEAALYLTDPQQMSKSARTLRLTISLIVLLLVVAIAIGGSLIATDIRRQVRLAQQKTDFVSNVSHELKTPLTSIRMFADLLAEGRVTEPDRQMTYLKIISAESARLTRLINNVLDFARQERGQSKNERHPCDLVETARDVVETCLPHLEASGQNLSCEIEAETLPLVGDRDALAQIILNLISNAEKYGGGEILVRMRRQETPTGPMGCVDVLDRGPGIPPKQVDMIFQPFHRLDDSLANGIPGSGLGLTLSRRMARAHGGDVTYSPRAGGGSCFTLAVPLTS